MITLFVSRKLSREYKGKPSRPDPELLYPPNGISAPVTGEVQLTPTVPASRPLANRMARSISFV